MSKKPLTTNVLSWREERRNIKPLSKGEWSGGQPRSKSGRQTDRQTNRLRRWTSEPQPPVLAKCHRTWLRSTVYSRWLVVYRYLYKKNERLVNYCSDRFCRVELQKFLRPKWSWSLAQRSRHWWKGQVCALRWFYRGFLQTFGSFRQDGRF